MHDAVELLAVALAVFASAEHAAAQCGPVKRLAGRIEKEVRRRGEEVLNNSVVSGRARLDDLAGDEVGVDDGEGVGWLAEEGRDGGFAGCD